MIERLLAAKAIDPSNSQSKNTTRADGPHRKMHLHFHPVAEGGGEPQALG
ncbi:hypothetical protein ABHF91_14285 [Pseudaeromonas sp. ZJS20]